MSRTTELRLPALDGFDAWPDAGILAALLDGQARAIEAVRAALPMIAAAAERITGNLRAGGRLVYAGAGASIRLAVQDGAELPATFGMAPDRIAYLIAGGERAIFETMAGAEDDADAGERDARVLALKPEDNVIAIAASGTTPYTIAVAQAARQAGATTIAIVNNAGSPLAAAADLVVCLESGPEVIAGSTRLGAGTAQKAALNLLSTLVHTRLGAVHDGYMVNVHTGNAKLAARAARIVAAISGASPSEAATALKAAGGGVKLAVLICKGAAPLEASRILAEAGGNLRLAMGRVGASS